VFDSFSTAIRVGGIRRLFQTPEVLFHTINVGLVDANLCRETSVALEFLAQPEPRGHFEEMLTAVASAQTTNQRAVRMLLRQFRALGMSSLDQLAYEFNLRLLRNEVAEPTGFIAHVAQAMYDDHERAEVLRILRLLSKPEPDGRRRALIWALGVARLNRPIEVNKLLQDYSWQTHAGMLSFKTQVKLVSFLSYIFSPQIASDLLGVDS
jgi:hypothetical protein